MKNSTCISFKINKKIKMHATKLYIEESDI